MKQLDIGLYINLFQVEVPNNSVQVVAANRKKYPNFRSLRDDIERFGQSIRIYADGDIVYGYGKDCDELLSNGFSESNIFLHDTPRLTSRMILEGFVKQIKEVGYEPLEQKGRVEAFNWNEYRSTRDGNVCIYQGFDLRSIFLKDRGIDKLVFGLVVDVTHAIRDRNGNSLNAHSISERFGSNTLIETRQIQGDLLPTRKINTEVSRQRLLERILPFVSKFSTFRLPCEVQVSLQHEPLRIILGGER